MFKNIYKKTKIMSKIISKNHLNHLLWVAFLIAIFMSACSSANETITPNNVENVDTTPPALTNISPISTLEKNTTGEIVFYFNEEITNFTTSNIKLSNAIVDGEDLIPNSKSKYTWLITPRKSGYLIINVPVGSFEDLAGNANTSIVSFQLKVIDTSPPLLTSISTNSALIKNIPGKISFYFNEDVYGFTKKKINLSGVYSLDEKELIRVSRKEYYWEITPREKGTLSINIPIYSFQDFAGNSNTSIISKSFKVEEDTTPPTVSITGLSLTEDTEVSEGRIIFTFNEDVNNFTKSDIKFANPIPIIRDFITNNQKSYELKVTPTAGGSLTVIIDAGSLEDLSGNPNQAVSTNLTVETSVLEEDLKKIVTDGRIPSNKDELQGVAKDLLSYYTGTPKVVAKYVKTDGTGDGSSWAKAANNPKSIINGISDASDSKIYLVLVASGNYLSDNIVMKNHVAIIGGWNRKVNWERLGVTRFNGQGKNRVFYNNGNNLNHTALLYSATITNGNISSRGGGMYNFKSSPSLENVTFSGNKADPSGGAANAGELKPENTTNYFGGGMYNWKSSPNLVKVTFSGNKANTFGGGMFNRESSPNLVKVTFSGNTAEHSGGGMFNYYDSSPNLVNITFSGNTAVLFLGGGMVNENKSSPILTNVNFSENKAGHHGGGMVNYNYSSPNLVKVTFSGNKADRKGGGMYNIIYSSPTLVKVTFSENKVGISGGGMYNDGYSSPILEEVTFSGNKANSSWGGGMANKRFSSPKLINVTFSGNKANNGGGMFNYYDSSPTLVKVTFLGNTAKEYGGGMANRIAYPKLTNVTFSGNKADTFGGGMYNRQKASPKLTKVTFSGNKANRGGGMYNYNYSFPNLTKVTFSGNTADSGGGMYNYYHSSPILDKVTFSGNKADISGGGMYNDKSSSPKLVNVTFSGNTADTSGGGMYNYFGSSPILANVTFSGNTAGTSGGGMYIWNHSYKVFSLSFLVNTIFWGNQAKGSPNQISFKNSIDKLSLHYSIIQGGASSLGGTLTTSYITEGDPLLSPLADNGGFIKTHALGNNSPAINKGLYVKKKGTTLYLNRAKTTWYIDTTLYFSIDKTTWYIVSGNDGSTRTVVPPGDAVDITDARGYIRTDRPDIGAYENGGIAPAAN